MQHELSRARIVDGVRKLTDDHDGNGGPVEVPVASDTLTT
jgi:hypothetical protein